MNDQSTKENSRQPNARWLQVASSANRGKAHRSASFFVADALSSIQNHEHYPQELIENLSAVDVFVAIPANDTIVPVDTMCFTIWKHTATGKKDIVEVYAVSAKEAFLYFILHSYQKKTIASFVRYMIEESQSARYEVVDATGKYTFSVGMGEGL